MISFLSFNSLDLIIPGLGSLWGHTVFIHIIHITSVLYLEKWVLNPNPKAAHKNWDLYAAYKIWGNPQLLNTGREAPNAHKMSTEISRITFVLSRTFQVVAMYALQKYVVDAVFPHAFSPISIQEFAPRQEIYFRRLLLLQVTLRETLMRTVLAFQWIWMNVFGLHCAQTAVAILFSIILRWDEPYEWPPLFGNPLDAWNLRRFWGKFWHKIVYRPYTAYGLCVARRLPFIARGSSQEKAFVACFVFLLSGLAHSLVTWHSVGCGFSRDIFWFLMNAAAAVTETAVIKWYRKTRSKKDARGWTSFIQKFRLEQVLGFAWVFAFMFWSVPKWEYGKIYCAVQRM